MPHAPYVPPENHEELKFPLKLSLTIITISLFVIGLVIYSFQLCTEMNTKYSPLIGATMEIQLESTHAHLLFEELLSGEKSGDLSDVTHHFDNARWYTNAMITGGENREGKFIALHNPELLQQLQNVLAKIESFKAVTLVRYDIVLESGIGNPIDQQYDLIFFELLKQIKQVETELQQFVATDLQQYNQLQVLLLITLVALTGLLLMIFYRYETQRIQNLQQLHHSLEEVKVLNGLIPICASCKKIRDDDGYWSQIETYIKEHSEADFTHGYCPECITKLSSDDE